MLFSLPASVELPVEVNHMEWFMYQAVWAYLFHGRLAEWLIDFPVNFTKLKDYYWPIKTPKGPILETELVLHREKVA